MDYSGVLDFFKEQPELRFLARVEEGTHIDIFEYDLFKFRKSLSILECGNWRGMVKNWLDKGATIDMFFQEIYPRALPVMGSLQDSYPSLRLYNISHMPKGILYDNRKKEEEFVEGFETGHFTLFQNPDQFWGEGDHPSGCDIMYDCSFVPEAVIHKKGKWFDIFNKNLSLIKILRENSQEIDISPKLLAS